MGKLFHMAPRKMHWPVGKVFQSTDQYNGHQRGTWYYRVPFTGVLCGPFHDEVEAQFNLDNEKVNA